METLPDKYNALQTSQVDEKVAQLIILAGEHKVSVEALKDILAMGREMKAEYAKEQYDKDMALFQSECPIITKTRFVPNNSGGGYRFAPIESIVRQVKMLLAEYNFSYSIKTVILNELPTGEIQRVAAICIVKHTLGHSEEYSFPTPLLKQTNMMNLTQQVAATFTFAKRYAFCNAFGILTGDEDTDAVKVVEVEYITDLQINRLVELLHLTGYTENTVLERCSVTKLEELTQAQGESIIKNLERVVAKNKDESK